MNQDNEEFLDDDLSNTNKRVKEILKEIKNNTESDYLSELELLEKSWAVLEAEYEQIDRNEQVAASPLESYRYLVNMGQYPPPEILTAINECFQEYTEKGGEISLDEAFFGSPFKQRKSPAYIHKQIWRFQHFHTLWVDGGFMPSKDEKRSLEEEAEAYLDNLFGNNDWVDHIDVESFLREYRRWKIKYLDK
jgi:hypothetical protein